MDVQDSNRAALIADLKERTYLVKRGILEMCARAHEGHVASAFSISEILVTLYFHILNLDPKSPDRDNSDRFLLSKGHGCAALYQTLVQRGFFDPKLLDTFLKYGSKFAGHPILNKECGIEMSTGSLGHGLSIAVGMALAARIDKQPRRVFVLVGDGECNEGMIWEAAMAAKHYALDNLVAVVDRNHYQCDGPVCAVMNTDPFADKWTGFGWQVREADGHNVEELVSAFSKIPLQPGSPTAIICKTVKGNGVSFMENAEAWHYRAPEGEELESALLELAVQRGGA